MKNDTRFNRLELDIRPEDIRSDLSYKKDTKDTNLEDYIKIVDDNLVLVLPTKIEKIETSIIKPIGDYIHLQGHVKIDSLETTKHHKITTKELINDEIVDGNLTINGNFTIHGDVDWKGKFNFVDSEIIRAEDNTIYLNHKGTHETAIGGGIILTRGVNDNINSHITIDDSGYWNVGPGMNLSTLNIENLNFESENDEINIYLNGKKVTLHYSVSE